MCTFLNFADRGSCILSESVDMLKRSVSMPYRTSIYIGDPQGQGERVAGGVQSQSSQLHAVDIYS